MSRISERYSVHLTTSSVFWGWVAQESTEGWFQLTGGRPQAGRGKPLMAWRVEERSGVSGEFKNYSFEEFIFPIHLYLCTR